MERLKIENFLIQKKRSSGSVIILVLILCAFCTIIATLFLRNALDEVKYRKQMQISAIAKIEAYSFLNLILSFLSNYKKTDNVSSALDSNNRGVRKDPNKLIFDEEIIGALPTPSFHNPSNLSAPSISDLISVYIAKNIPNELANADGNWPNNFTDVTFDTTTTHARLKHGDLTIEITFEDLNAKIPLCKEFDSSAPGLIKVALASCGVPESSISKINEFLGITEKLSQNDPKYIFNWTSFEKIGNITDSNVVQKVKNIFTLESSIVSKSNNPTAKGAATDKNIPGHKKSPMPPKIINSNLKINLLTACHELRNHINSWAQGGNIISKAGITLSNNRKKEDIEKFINDHSINISGGERKQFSNFCSAETLFFSLKICVNSGTGNSFSLICFCETSSSTTTTSVGNSQFNTKRHLPFNIVKIEEI
ncbi:MAG: hypothetical protein LBH08_03110 [Puniceicoccales bacterium]|nr:hypothetical protein [Puniceicoccales bacterium]